MEHAKHALIALALIGCGNEPLPQEAHAGTWASIVFASNGADASQLFGDPDLAANGARGAGCCGGGTDVYAMSPALGRDSLILGFAEGPVFDREGPELAVFENPFDIAGGTFMDPTVVYVSPDGIDFVSFPVDYRAVDPALYSDDPADWVGFAGITPVLLNEDTHQVDPLDPASAGGDVFDFDHLPDSDITDRIFASGASHILLVPASEEADSRTGQPYPADPISDGPDIDAVYAAFE